MRPNRVTLTLAACGAIVLTTWLLLPPDTAQHDQPVSAAPASALGNTDQPRPPPSIGQDIRVAQLTPEQQALLEDPRVIKFEQRLAFQQQVRDYFDQAENLTGDENQQQAEALERQLAHYEQTGEVSTPEALMLKLALINTTVADEARQQELAQVLIERYRQASQQREQAWLADRDPRFETYKDREQAIVAEVMAMDQFPGGMTRDQYLRERLQQARIDSMGDR